MRTLWAVSLISLSVTAQTYPTPTPAVSVRPSTPKSLSEDDLNVDLNSFYGADTSFTPPLNHASGDSNVPSTPLLDEIGEQAPPAQPIVMPAPGDVYGPVNPLPEHPRLPMPLPLPLVDAVSKFEQDLQTNVTNLQQNAQKAAKEVEKNIIAFKKGVIIPLTKGFEGKLKKLFKEMEHPPIYYRQRPGHTYCYWSVRTMLESAGFAKKNSLTNQNARDAGQNLLAAGFKLIPWVKNPSQAPPGAVLVYGRGVGHAEIVNENGLYVHYMKTAKYGGNRRIFKAAYFPPGAIVKPPGSHPTGGT